MHLVEQKPYNLLPQLWKYTQNIKKVGNGKCKKGSLPHIEWRYFYLLGRKYKNIIFSKNSQELNVAISQKEYIVVERASRRGYKILFMTFKSLKVLKLDIHTQTI